MEHSWDDVFCASDHIFVQHHCKLLGATLSLGTEESLCLRHTLLELKGFKAVVLRAFGARLTALSVNNLKTESLTKTRDDAVHKHDKRPHA